MKANVKLRKKKTTLGRKLNDWLVINNIKSQAIRTF